MLWKKHGISAPPFIWDADKLLRAEWLFLAETGGVAGAAKRLSAPRQTELAVAALCEDIVCNLEIEGEFIATASVAAGLRRQLGISLEPAEEEDPAVSGCVSLALEVVQGHARPLPPGWLGRWGEFFHSHFRSDDPPPPSLPWARQLELRHFRDWFGGVAPDDDGSPLVRAGLAHLWFESIHPLPLGSGVLGRHLAQRVLAAALPNHLFVQLGRVLLRRRTEYLRLLDEACRDHDATQWLLWFAAAAIEAGRLARARVNLAVGQENLLASLREQLSGSQHAMLLYFFQLGTAAFLPGASPAGYAAETGTPLKSAAADMANLAALGALTRSVRARSLRYHLALPSPDVARVNIEDIL